MQYLIDKRHDSDYGVSFPDFPGVVTAGTGETQADVARTYNVDATTIERLQPSPFERVSAAA